MSRLRAFACALLVALAGVASAGADPSRTRVVIGIDHAFPPYQWLAEDGKPRGFDVDLIRALAKVTNLEFEIRTGPWYEIRAQLERGEIDAVASMIRTPERERLLEFSIPTSHVAHTVFVREDADFENLTGRVVAIERGAVADDLLPERVPSAKPLRTETALDALRALADGRADAAILLDTQGLSTLTAAATARPGGSRGMAVGGCSTVPQDSSI